MESNEEIWRQGDLGSRRPGDLAKEEIGVWGLRRAVQDYAEAHFLSFEKSREEKFFFHVLLRWKSIPDDIYSEREKIHVKGYFPN